MSSPRLQVAAAATALHLFAAGCGFEPSVPVQRHVLNGEAVAENAELAEDATAQDQLRGALDMLFGTPEHPGYMLVESWIDDEYDPNLGGYAELDDDAFDRLKEGNRHRFRAQIAAIEAGDLDAVDEPRYASDLWADWLVLREDLPDDLSQPLDPEEPDAGTWADEAAYLFEGYYPSLSESAEFYRQQCKHCHGVSGGGDGSTSPYLNPRPRDYRHGIFKFTALANKARPRREDLFRVLTEGVYTTAMPSFRRFSDAQLHGLVDYVRLLSMRGETELLLAQDFDGFERFGGLEKLVETYTFVHDRWQEGPDNVIVFEGEVPEATPELLARGRQLFLGEEGTGANCASCHSTDGRGDGPSAFEVDPESGERVRVKDDWGVEIEPRDLTGGNYRFGRRPIDLYRRIYAGINGTPMPEHIGMMITEDDGSQRPLSEEDVWALVHFVRSLGARAPEVGHAETAGHDGHGG